MYEKRNFWETKVIGFLKKNKDFWFIIPQNREKDQRDFFVSAKNMGNAWDNAKVEALILSDKTGKRPEAKIIRVLEERKKIPVKEYVEGIFFNTNEKFGFIDVEWQKKWFFVYGKNKNKAQDGDRVRAELKNYNGNKEGIIIEILQDKNEIAVGKYQDNGNFWFVLIKTNGVKEDVFIPGSRKNWAINGDIVEINILKRWGKNPEWAVKKIIEEWDDDEDEDDDYNLDEIVISNDDKF